MRMTKSATCVIVGASHAAAQLALGLRQYGWAGHIIVIGEEQILPYHRPPLSKSFLTGEKSPEDILIRKAPVYKKAGIDFILGVRARMIDRGEKRGREVVICGGGYIGLETAAALKQQGMNVTVLELMPRVLQRVVTPELSAFYTRIHAEEGVKIITNVRVASFQGDNKVQQVVCEDGRAFPADLVIGDCTFHPNRFYGRDMRLESVQNAMDQAKTAAATLCGKQGAYDSLPWFWSDQYDLKLQIAGLSQGYDEVVLRGDMSVGRSFAVFYMREGVLISVDAINRPQEFLVGKRLIKKGYVVNGADLQDESVPIKNFL